MADKPPVYDGIKQQLKSRIEGGDLSEGARVPSEIELAKQFGVNRSQTRLALRELEVEGYLVRRQGSGSYVAPRTGQVPSIRTDRATAVAMIFPRFLSRYSHQVVEAFMIRVAQEGFESIAYNVQSAEETEAASLNAVAESGVSGLAVWIEHDNQRVRNVLARLRGSHFPVVLVDRHLKGLDVDCVVSDNDEVGYRLTRALIGRGHRRIAFATLEQNPPSSVEERLNGYRRALEEASIPFDEGFVAVQSGRLRDMPPASAIALMTRRDRPTAFVCIHDGVAKYLYYELLKLGYYLPEHVELAAVDDDHPPQIPRIPMLGIGQPGLEIGAQSAEVLLARMAHPESPTQQRQIKPTSPVCEYGEPKQSQAEMTEKGGERKLIGIPVG